MQVKQGDYQTQSRKTWKYVDTKNDPIIYPCLGLSNEVGEVLGKVKKVFRDNNGKFSDEIKADLKAELGDVLWYLTQICTELDLTLEDIAEYNLDKLFSRLERGKIQGSGDNR